MFAVKVKLVRECSYSLGNDETFPAQGSAECYIGDQSESIPSKERFIRRDSPFLVKFNL